jgi:chorismate mutase/prephenate dehydratase
VQIAKAEATSAAVANELSATVYDVPIVEKNIQDKSNNTTRFVVIGKAPSGPVGNGRDMSSFLIALGEEASAHSGSLLRMLKPFAERGLNLSKIESRPTKRKAWDYYFFVDVTGHHEEPAMQEAIAELRKFCPMVKWLGSYPAAG